MTWTILRELVVPSTLFGGFRYAFDRDGFDVFGFGLWLQG
jgi:hypothetical protein